MSGSPRPSPEVPSASHLTTPGAALRLSLGYAAVGAVWILVSGWLVHHFLHNNPLEPQIELLKGWLFIAVTALVLWVALDRYFRIIRGPRGKVSIRTFGVDGLRIVVVQRARGSASFEPFVRTAIYRDGVRVR